MNIFEEKLYKDMLPKAEKKGKLGYYPVTSKQEWEDLPDLYKTMEWEPIRDPHSNKLRAVKSVIFHVPHMEPYGISANVAVHPENVHKILFCNFPDPDCQLYSITAVELEGGTRLGAKWLQDSISGAFAVVVGKGTYVGRQGGFRGFIPDHIKCLEDGTFKFDFKYGKGKTNHYTLGNPFRHMPEREQESLNDIIENAESKPGKESQLFPKQDSLHSHSRS